jgi:hypothetical protein
VEKKVAKRAKYYYTTEKTLYEKIAIPVTGREGP